MHKQQTPTNYASFSLADLPNASWCLATDLVVPEATSHRDLPDGRLDHPEHQVFLGTCFCISRTLSLCLVASPPRSTNRIRTPCTVRTPASWRSRQVTSAGSGNAHQMRAMGQWHDANSQPLTGRAEGVGSVRSPQHMVFHSD